MRIRVKEYSWLGCVYEKLGQCSQPHKGILSETIMGIGARSLTRLPNKVSRKKKVRPSSRTGRDARSGGYIPRPGLAPQWTSSDPWSEQPHSGQFFTISRVSLVCNVCSRLLPKEWFAERPMASARANSRVPPPRHLCIIMLSPRAPALTRSLSPPIPPHRPSRHCEKFAPFFLPAAAVPQPLPSALLVLLSAPTLSHFLSTLVSFRVGKKERKRGRRRRNVR